MLFKSFDLLSSIPNSFELAFLWYYIIFVQVIVVLLLIFICEIKVVRKMRARQRWKYAINAMLKNVYLMMIREVEMSTHREAIVFNLSIVGKSSFR